MLSLKTSEMFTLSRHRPSRGEFPARFGAISWAVLIVVHPRSPARGRLARGVPPGGRRAGK